VSAKRLAWAARRITKRVGGSIDVAIVLGSGLAGAVLARVAGGDIAYRKLGAPRATVPGHAGIARIGMWEGRRVVAFAGRAHLYEGYSPRDVTYLVRLAAASGATTIVLTNAAGGLNGAYVAGDVMVVADQINLTGTSPISRDEREPFVAMHDAYAPRLRKLARACGAQREGVYAGVRGPQYETRAESEMLRVLGADAVGMSTVLETIEARRLGLDVLGLSLITNAVGANDVSHERILEASRVGAERIASIVEGVLRDS